MDHAILVRLEISQQQGVVLQEIERGIVREIRTTAAVIAGRPAPLGVLIGLFQLLLQPLVLFALGGVLTAGVGIAQGPRVE